MDAEESITMNGAQQKDDEMRWNHKKRTKDCFLMFCEVVLQHERELLSETLNSSQESINENRAPESGQIGNESTDSDGANGEMAPYTNEGAEGGDGDSFNSVTCFCGKPFAGRPMIECSGCLTWLHMSCAKVKRKNIPEFYYCDTCKVTGPKSNGLLSPSALMSNTSSGEETLSPTSHNGTSTLSSNSIDGVFANTNLPSTKPRKPKSMKKSMISSDKVNFKPSMNNASESKKSFNGKLKKSSTKKMRQSPTKATKAYASSSLSAAASLTELSLNHQVAVVNGGENSLLKSPITTNNNTIYDTTPAMDTENGGDMDKFNSKRLKTL